MNDMSSNLGFQLSFNKFFRLRGIATHAKIQHNILPAAKRTKIESIFNLGLKVFREIISFQDKVDQGAISRVALLAKNNLYPVISDKRHIDLRKTAFSTFFPNFQKDFFFRHLNNTLLLNHQLAKIDLNIDPRCVYCRSRTTPLVSPQETTVHNFVTCPTLTNIAIAPTCSLIRTSIQSLIYNCFFVDYYRNCHRTICLGVS